MIPIVPAASSAVKTCTRQLAFPAATGRRVQQFARNYEFFGAPVGPFFCLDRRLRTERAVLEEFATLRGFES